MQSRLVRWLVVASGAFIVVVGLVVNAWWPKRPIRSHVSQEATSDSSEATPASRALRSAGRPERSTRMRTRVAGSKSAPAAPSADGDGGLDPEALAIWEAVNAEDQETLQPEDLEVEPPAPPLDLRTIPAYRALNVDADGNLN